jgi:serine/threonine-protein kinase
MTANACVKCGNALEAGVRFCGGCGTQQPGAVIPQAAVRTNAKTMFQGGGAAPVVAPKPAQANVAFDRTIAPGTTPAPVMVPKPAPAPAAAPVTSQRAAAPAAEPLDGDLTGKTLNNRYQIEGKLGEGGFGAVYKAKQLNMGRTVALKVLHARMAKDQQVIGRFKREAQASSLLRAPHTVQVYDFDQSPEGVMYLAMEILQGKSLHAIVRDEGPLDPVRVARVLDGIADSLGEAHGQGIVHRDIKPENIYLEPRPTPDFVKVLDFGIAKIVSGDGLAASGPALTAAGQTLGTLEYMSPEQLMGQQLDGRSDLYALGVMSYELLTGALPWPAKTPGELITAHLKTMPPPPSKAKPGIPPLLDQIILRLVEKQREKRYANTDELRKDLQRVIQGEQGSAMPQAMAPAPQPAAPQHQANAGHTEKLAPIDDTPKPAMSKNLILIIAGVVIAVAAIVGLLVMSSKH